MNELTNHTDAFVHFKRSSLLSKLSDTKMIIGLLALMLIYTVAWGVFWTTIFGVFGQFNFAACFFTAILLGASCSSLIRFADRRWFGSTKLKLMAIEDRLIGCNTQCPREELEQLLTESLKLKRIAAADIYSKRLLEITLANADATPKTSDWLATVECWASTDQYHKTFKYLMIWRETRGVLTLTPDYLDFESKTFAFHCHPSQISSIEVKRHPLWVKPIPLKFISVTIDDLGCKHTFCLTPSFGHTDSVADCNRLVDTWSVRLQNARAAHRI